MWLPGLLIIASAVCVYLYHINLNSSITTAGEIWVRNTGSVYDAPIFDGEEVLNTTDLQDVPNAPRLMVLYLGVFVFAEASFILMAVKEYLQDLLQYSDTAIVKLVWEVSTQTKSATTEPS
jgi:hypothetical protein